MQTFLPYEDFQQSARCLDYRRLGKQRVEAMQLVNVLLPSEDPAKKRGWANHPAALMWAGHVEALMLYHNVCVYEWCKRGYKNTMEFYQLPPLLHIKVPKWLGNEDFHASHRSNLLRKDPVHYGKNSWTEPHDLPYVWPKP